MTHQEPQRQLEALIPTWAPLLAQDHPAHPGAPGRPPACRLQRRCSLMGQKWCRFLVLEDLPQVLLPPNPPEVGSVLIPLSARLKLPTQPPVFSVPVLFSFITISPWPTEAQPAAGICLWLLLSDLETLELPAWLPTCRQYGLNRKCQGCNYSLLPGNPKKRKGPLVCASSLFLPTDGHSCLNISHPLQQSRY